MDALKFTLFSEFVTMFICGLIHLSMFFTKQYFPLFIYPMMAGIVLAICLFAVYVVTPIYNRFFS